MANLNQIRKLTQKRKLMVQMPRQNLLIRIKTLPKVPLRKKRKLLPKLQLLKLLMPKKLQHQKQIKTPVKQILLLQNKAFSQGIFILIKDL